MATYGLKYTSGAIVRNGVTYTLNISQRDYSGATLEIGDLQALGLEIQGASGGIDAPIAKTLLHFTVADTVDIGTVGGVKHGGWEEFYTPDATLYQVDLKRGTQVIWRGYITPDSWNEPLNYRGSITVTARDNIGHMADFEFSKAALLEWMSYLGGTSVARVRDDNLVSIYELVFAAFGVAGIGMTFRTNWDSGDSGAEPHLMAGTADVKDWLIDIDSLADLDWYHAVERVLASAGLVLRWTEGLNISLMSLRSLHKMGTAGSQPARAANFVNRSGHRTLDPAYRQIVERLDYDCTDGYEAEWAAEDFEVTQRSTGMVRYVSALTDASDWTQDDDTKEVVRYADPTKTGMGDVTGEAEKYVLVAGRPATAPPAPVGPSDYYEKVISYIDLDNFVKSPGKRLSTNTVVTVGFNVAHSYKGAGASTGFSILSSYLPYGVVRYAITWKKSDGTYLSLQDGEWVTGVSIREVAVPPAENADPLYIGNDSTMEEIAVSDTFQTPDVPGMLELRLYPYRIELLPTYNEQDLDAHVRVGNIAIDINSEAVPRYFKTVTVYDESQNKTLKRDVDYGAVPTRYQTAGTIRNGFYKPDASNGYPSVMDCHWDGDSTELPLPVLNHLQILSLHAKPNSVLGGELRDANGQPIVMNAVWTYGGRNFLLISGTWNILTDRVQDAVLREFDTYADAIGAISVDYDTELSGGDARLAALQKGINAAASQARANTGGGGGGGTGTVTSVALSIPTYFDISGSPVTSSGTLTATLKSSYKIPSTTEWNSVNGMKHSHENLNTLDYITAEEVNNWDSAYNASHNHSNLGVLNGITSTKVSHWDDAYDAISNLGITSQDIEHWNAAYDNSHTHSNLSVLNGITSQKVSDWDTAATNSHSHSNKSLLDTISQSDLTAWDGAATNSHTHSNKSTLDSITAAKMEGWDDAADKAHSHSNKSTLDSITSTQVTHWDAAYTDKHSHGNKSVLDGISSTDVTAWNGAAADSHSHSNKSVLDDISSTDVTAWNAAATDSHTHSNMSVLSGITSTKVSSWDSAATYAHSHTNKSVLDGITSTKVSNWDSAVTYAHSHSNKTALDTITSQKVSQWDGAATNSHSHTNKSVLDGITAEKVSAWDAAALGDSIDISVGGTADDPTVAVELGTGAQDYVALPKAGSAQAGILSTGAQTIAGDKTFNGKTTFVDKIYVGQSNTYNMWIEWDHTVHAFKLVGDIYATGEVAAGNTVNSGS